ERRYGLRDRAPAEEDEAQAPVGEDETEELVDLACDPDSLLGRCRRPRKLPQLGKAPSTPPARGDGQPVTPIAPQSLGNPAESPRALSIVPRVLPDHSELVVRRCLERDVTEADGDGQSPPGQLAPAI